MEKKNSAPKRFAVSVNVLIQIILAAAALVFINMTIFKWHPPKIDLTQNKYYELSDKTRNLLKNLASPVDVIVFFQPNSSDPVTSKVFMDIQNLLKEYEYAAPKNIKVKYIDPDRDPVGTDKLAQEYNVEVPNVVVFSYKEGDKEKRSKFVKVEELVEFDSSGGPYAQSNRIKSFKGEQQFTSAIQNVLDAKQPKVYFVQGHGEGDPEGYDPRTGYSTISTYIRRDNVLVEKLNILEKQGIPKDCDLLVICSPEKPYAEEEIKTLEDYLTHNGRMMVLLEGLKDETGMEKFLESHGVKVGNDLVLVQMQNPFTAQVELKTIAPGLNYTAHPVTQSLQKDKVVTLFPTTRSVDKAPGSDSRERVTVLVETVDAAWAETNLSDLRNNKAVLDDKDRKGPVPIAVAVEPNSAGEMEREGMRMVVFGSGSFVRNGKLQGGNVDLFMNAVNWLLKRQQLIGIAAKAPQEFSLSLDDFQKRGVFLVEVVGIPLAIAILGFLVWFKRRK